MGDRPEHPKRYQAAIKRKIPMNDMDPKQQNFPLILYPFAWFLYALCAVKTGLARAGIIKTPPPNDNWRSPPW